MENFKLRAKHTMEVNILDYHEKQPTGERGRHGLVVPHVWHE